MIVQNINPKRDASHLGTQTELRPATPAKRHIKSESPAYKTTPIRLHLVTSFMRRLLRRRRPLSKKETMIMMMMQAPKTR